MTSVETTAPKLFARDIAAYSDEELDRYLEVNGRVLTDIDDAGNLPDDFIQRLRDRVPSAGETAQSRPVDLDRVATRLRDVFADKERSSRCPSPATTPPPLTEEEQYRDDLQLQTKFYNALVDNGGRPSHPLSRLEDIVRNPGEYRQILSFWQGRHPQDDEWRVFSTQLGRWLDFQMLQRFARGQSAYDYQRSIWEAKRKVGGFFSARMQVHLYGEDQWEREWRRTKKIYGGRRVVFVSGQHRPWEQFVERQGRTTEQQGFPEYVEALKERLTRYGFARTIQLDEDAARQDKLTTWIEYLGYEYWWYDQDASFAKGHQRRHDDAWKKLVDAKVLRPEETEEIVCSIDTAFHDASEEERAEKAIRSATSAVSSAEKAISKSQMSRLSIQDLRQRLVAAQSTLEAAKEIHESIKRRIDLITEFKQRTRDYRSAKDDAERHSILLHWMLQQVPLIELELNEPKVARNKSGQRDGGRKRKRPEEFDEEQHCQEQARDEGGRHSVSAGKTRTVSTLHRGETRKCSHDAIDKGRHSKRRKNSGRSLSLSGRPSSDPLDLTTSARRADIPKTTRIASKAREVKGSKASLDQSSRISKPLRHSSRIAEREQQLRATAAAPSDTVRHPHQKTALAHVLTPPSSTERKAHKAISETKTRRGRPERRSRRNTSKPQGISKRNS